MRSRWWLVIAAAIAVPTLVVLLVIAHDRYHLEAGSVAAWVTGIITAAALAAAAWNLWRIEEDKRSAQAREVSFWLTGEGPNRLLHLLNNSVMPVHNVAVRFTIPEWDSGHLVLDALPPRASAANYVVNSVGALVHDFYNKLDKEPPEELRLLLNRPIQALTVTLRFRDADGRQWVRSSDGSLRREKD